MLSLKSIPQCDSKVIEFNVDKWEGMIQRVRQMTATNGHEHRINWTLNLDAVGKSAA